MYIIIIRIEEIFSKDNEPEQMEQTSTAAAESLICLFVCLFVETGGRLVSSFRFLQVNV